MEKSKIQLIQSQSIALSLLDTNDGQIAGVPANPRTIDPVDFANLKKSIEDNPEMLGMRELLVYPVGGRYVVIGGNMRLKAMRDLGFSDAPCKVLPESTDTATLRAVLIKDNVQKGEWDAAMLQNDWSADELQEWGVELPEFEQPEAERVKDNNNESKGVLSQKFLIPPFSIFDTRQGYWQERKKMWRDRICDLGESREGALRLSLGERYPAIYRSSMKERKRLGISFEEYFEKYVSQKEKDEANKSPMAQGVSIFDPVVSEICCKWFTPYAGAKIFDCFSGDTQKGLVFAMCGYEFAGVELRQEQVDINNRVIADRNLPIRYICDDGCNVANHFEPESQDMLFSCPPYFDLEVYSDMPNDASNQCSYEDFIEILRKAFTSALSCLK